MLTKEDVKEYLLNGLKALYPDHDYENDIDVIKVPADERPVGTKVNEAAAVYMFYYPNHKCYLRIGKASKGNTSRYGTQNYRLYSGIKTSLPHSIIEDPAIQFKNKNNEENMSHEEYSDIIENWIIKNTRRMDIFLRNPVNEYELALVESMLHFRCKPKYEKSAKGNDCGKKDA